MYGVKNNKEQDVDVPESKVQEIESTIFALVDTNKDQKIDLKEWLAFKAKGGSLPDFGFAGSVSLNGYQRKVVDGFRHHEDEETEFDIHHVELFHSDPNDNDETKWNHPEDIGALILYHLRVALIRIEHFRKHDEKFYFVESQDPLRNIPMKVSLSVLQVVRRC